MGNCSCLERPRVTAWDNDDDWGLPARRSGEASREATGNGGVKLKIRMTKGQLRRLLESAGHGASPDEDVVAEVMSMGAVRVEVVAAAGHRQPKRLDTIQEDDLDE